MIAYRDRSGNSARCSLLCVQCVCVCELCVRANVCARYVVRVYAWCLARVSPGVCEYDELFAKELKSQRSHGARKPPPVENPLWKCDSRGPLNTEQAL